MSRRVVQSFSLPPLTDVYTLNFVHVLGCVKVEAVLGFYEHGKRALID